MRLRPEVLGQHQPQVVRPAVEQHAALRRGDAPQCRVAAHLVVHGAAVDVTRQARDRLLLERLSATDAVTGLCNRLAFDRRMQERLERTRETEQVSIELGRREREAQELARLSPVMERPRVETDVRGREMESDEDEDPSPRRERRMRLWSSRRVSRGSQ